MLSSEPPPRVPSGGEPEAKTGVPSPHIPGIQMGSEPPPRVPSRSEPEAKTLGQKEREILRRTPLAYHWRTPIVSGAVSRLQWIVFNILCLTAHGHAGLGPVWAAIKVEDEGDESLWVEMIRQMCDRLNNMLVVASLLLGTSAVFITTPPPIPTTVNYTLRGPYICMLSAFGLLIGGLIVAAVVYLLLSRSKPHWLEHVLYVSRFQVYCTLIIFSYPFFAIGTATVLLALGMHPFFST
ncbi:hypothetical protein C8R44DRAFT_797350 [Mycena epipterygia]|nr:hypothetical protein C8R44DRAFT_797350 [Mycena epipterygia]